MTGAHGDVAEELSRIRREFDGWHPWMSSGGRWWATRTGSQRTDPPEWWAMTVDADDAEGLREAITRQEQNANSAGPRDRNRIRGGIPAIPRSAPVGNQGRGGR